MMMFDEIIAELRQQIQMALNKIDNIERVVMSIDAKISQNLKS